VQNHIRYSSNIQLIKFHPRRAEEKVQRVGRLLRSLRKPSMYLKSLNLNLNQLRKRLLVREESRRKSHPEEAEAAMKVHATHARIGTESIPESAKKKSSGRSSKRVIIQDTLSTPKSKPTTSKTKLKGAPFLTPQEQEVVDIMQALKESKKTSRRQLEKVILEWGDEQDSEFSNNDNDDVEKDDKDGNVDDEGDDHVNDTQDADDEDVKTEFD
ncbi:hypothetical protein Tco_0113546, partial [Tanacetum coccineum]